MCSAQRYRVEVVGPAAQDLVDPDQRDLVVEIVPYRCPRRRAKSSTPRTVTAPVWRSGTARTSRSRWCVRPGTRDWWRAGRPAARRGPARVPAGRAGPARSAGHCGASAHRPAQRISSPRTQPADRRRSASAAATRPAAHRSRCVEPPPVPEVHPPRHVATARTTGRRPRRPAPDLGPAAHSLDSLHHQLREMRQQHEERSVSAPAGPYTVDMRPCSAAPIDQLNRARTGLLRHNQPGHHQAPDPPDRGRTDRARARRTPPSGFRLQTAPARIARQFPAALAHDQDNGLDLLQRYLDTPNAQEHERSATCPLSAATSMLQNNTSAGRGPARRHDGAPGVVFDAAYKVAVPSMVRTR